ncbi:hypothetical protein D9615_008469 [Tricholomella constricta]|uniref:Uncharacterized protein n=1 Tax=Tricholomella constricta TaxID=117010 RepID=A0A8H5M0H4_9AGAR|nr:hypothetical protein D9615_008469 [Tricholomella constricta]
MGYFPAISVLDFPSTETPSHVPPNVLAGPAHPRPLGPIHHLCWLSQLTLRPSADAGALTHPLIALAGCGEPNLTAPSASPACTCTPPPLRYGGRWNRGLSVVDDARRALVVDLPAVDVDTPQSSDRPTACPGLIGPFTHEAQDDRSGAPTRWFTTSAGMRCKLRAKPRLEDDCGGDEDEGGGVGGGRREEEREKEKEKEKGRAYKVLTST